MAFELEKVVPWGRNMNEYRRMFDLTDDDLDKSVISFGDGPASFNVEMTQKGKRVISVDPVYRFSAKEIAQRVEETKSVIMEQVKANAANFIWKEIKSPGELEAIRLKAMSFFIYDFEKGKAEGRYIDHALPAKTDFDEGVFGMALSSHFLLLYTQLGLAFHISSIQEMLRVANEARIFPVLDLDAKESVLLRPVIDYFEGGFDVQLREVVYEFQQGGNKMLTIKKKPE
ncbi:hypothetical protein [Niabella aquatica]